MQKDEERDVPIGSTKESLGKIDFNEGVPLDREEEHYRKVDSMRHQDEADSPRTALDLLLRTRLSDLSPPAPTTVPLGSSVADACRLMAKGQVGCVLVMEGERLAGILTERDVLYQVAGADRRASELRVDELMTADPTTLRAGHRVAHALNKMSIGGCRHLPILDEHGLAVGVLSVRRIVDFLAEQFPEKLLNLPPDLDQQMTTRHGG